MRRPFTATVRAPARPSIYAGRHRLLRPGLLHHPDPAASRHAATIITALPPAAPGFISDSVATTPSPSGVTDLARDRLDHPLVIAIHLIYAA